MVTTTIEAIGSQPYTVVWHNLEAKAVCSSHKRLWPIEWRVDGVGEWFASDGTHIATALPALPRHPKREDEPLLYLYAAQGLFVCRTWMTRNLNEIGWSATVERFPFLITPSPSKDMCKITHAIDKNGNKVQVAIADAMIEEGNK